MTANLNFGVIKTLAKDKRKKLLKAAQNYSFHDDISKKKIKPK